METETKSPARTRVKLRGGFAAAFRRRSHSFTASRLSRLTIAGILAVGLAAVFVQPTVHAQTPSQLAYAGGYLITGDYVVSGVDIAGSSVGGFIEATIPMSGVPPGAEIIDAVLYWEAITTQADINEAAGVQFRGVDIDINDSWTVKKYSQDLTGQTASCWSSGSPLMMTVFRASVLHHLPVQKDANGAPTVKRLVNDADLIANGLPLNTVRLPKWGTGNQTPETAGAGLVIVYSDTTKPLRKIVVYDGIHIQLPGEATSLALQGIYKSAQTKNARVSVMGASGQKNPTDRLYFNGSLIATDMFPDSPNASSERAWANPTFLLSEAVMSKTTNPPLYGETSTALVNHQKTNPYECLAWGAIIFSTNIADVDGDGLPDGLERGKNEIRPTGGFPPFKDPGMGPDKYLPNLREIGARTTRKDFVIEVNALEAPAGTKYGPDGDPDQQVDDFGHTHLPSPQVIRMFGDAFKNAPFVNPDDPDFPAGIKVHVDVGNLDAYRGLGVVSHPDADWVDDYTSHEADEYLVPSNLARGGEMIQERACVPSETVDCLFADHPGTVGWPLGLEALKYAPVGPNGEELTADQMAGWLASSTRRIRFDSERIGLVYYLLYAHSRGTPQSLFPCLDTAGKPAPYDGADGTSCATADNPDLRKPTSSSGIAHWPGYQGMITLGQWDGFRGRPFIQASTTVHEFGHMLGLGHGGFRPEWGNALEGTTNYFETNCKPNHPSVMSYSIQGFGLLDDLGNQHLDYSRDPYPLDDTRDVYPEIDETDLFSVTFNAPFVYRPAWFTPVVPGTLEYSLGVTPARRFCPGFTFPDPLPENWVPMARVDSGTTTTPIDWTLNRDFLNWRTLDVNFDGALSGASQNPATRPLRSFNDWVNIRPVDRNTALNAFGYPEGILRLEGGGIFTLADGGILRLEGGGILRLEGGGILRLEGGGILRLEGGGILYTEGFEDAGILRLEGGGILRLEGGGILRLEGGGQGRELTYQAAKEIGRTPPRAFRACVLGDTCPGPQPPPFDPEYHRVRLSWEAPNVGHVFKYRVYRVRGTTVEADTPRVLVATVNGNVRTAVDTEELPDDEIFTYFATAEFDDETPHAISPPSNFATVTAVNEAPVAVNDSYTTGWNSRLTVPAPGVLGNDTDVDSDVTYPQMSVVLITPPAQGRLVLNPDGSFRFDPDRFLGTVTFTYQIKPGFWSRDPSVAMSDDSNIATVTIVTVK